jgi:hypothetical protein
VVDGRLLVAGRRSRPVPEGVAQGHGSLPLTPGRDALASPGGRALQSRSRKGREAPPGRPLGDALRHRTRERLHVWSSSFRVASSGIAAVTENLYLTLVFR